MKKIVPILLLFSIVFLYASSPSLAQGRWGKIGKILTKVESTQLFGDVTFQVPLNVNDVKFALKHSGNYVIFVVKNGNVVVLNEKSLNHKDFDKAYAFSKSVVEKFVNSSKANVYYFQIRGGANWSKYNSTVATSSDGVMTLSDGESELEMAIVCPPICMY